MESVLAIALTYLDAGLSIIPIRADGSKAPAIRSWSIFCGDQGRLPTAAEVSGWYADNGKPCTLGIAIIGGRVSGGLSMLDFEFPDFYSTFCRLVEDQKPGLIGSLPQVQTPGKGADSCGHHLYFRSLVVVKCCKLARLTAAEALERLGDAGKTTAIEVKGESGYCLAPGCPAQCHESGRLYKLVGGPFIEEVPTLTDEEVDLLLSTARSLCRQKKLMEDVPADRSRSEVDANRPGDYYNREMAWQEVLTPHGWALVKDHDGVQYWRRPGKSMGISATAGFCTSPLRGSLLRVFSSNATPLVEGKCYSKFEAYSHLNHGGDYRKAATCLADAGFGIDLWKKRAEDLAKKILPSVNRAATDIESIVDQLLAGKCLSEGIEITAEERLAVVRKVLIEADPDKLAGHIEKEIDSIKAPSADGANPSQQNQDDPSRWKLVIVGNDPGHYLLLSPYWNGDIRLSAVQLLSWGKIRAAALDQAKVIVPKLSQKLWDSTTGPLARLLEKAERRHPTIISRVQEAEAFVYGYLAAAKPLQTDDAGEPRWSTVGMPTRSDGFIYFKISVLRREAKEQSLTFNEIKEVLSAMTISRSWPTKPRTRWWRLAESSLAALGLKSGELETS